MFAEEEWTDNLAGNGQSYSVVKAEPLLGKHKPISKNRLKQTLQTLGSAPDWEWTKAPVGSDEETEEAPRHLLPKRKKQRCKKRKETVCKPETGTGGDTGWKTDTLQKPVKKRKAKPKVDTADTEQSSKRSGKAVGVSVDNKLSRQQWKNKMRNKRRSKNKFLPDSGAVADVKLQEKLKQPQDLSSASAEKKKTQAITDVANKGVHQVPPTKPVCDGPKSNALRPVEADQKMAKKRLLNIQATESEEKKANGNQEQENGLLLKHGEDQMDRSSALRSRMEKKLESARFRYINELLYTSTSGEAKRMFQQDPGAIRIYHKGYTEQVKHWPANPVDTIIAYIRQRPSSLVIADFGCGDCKIARSVKNQVHCFDLAPVCDLVTVCDMANVPLGDSTVDIAVFCLSLMGTNLTDFLAEANRVLVMGGVLKVAEVASRFDNIRQFAGALSHLGFKPVSKDTDNSHFYSFEFLKSNSASRDVKKIGVELKPCLYKKR